jgi:hypothetical protein
MAMILVLAASPAICEEVLFRGAILSGLREKLHPVTLCLVVGLLFGLFHLTIFRMFVTGLSGVLLAYLVWRSGSIYMGMLAHFLINGSGVLLASERLPAPLMALFDEEALLEQGGMPWWLLGAAVAVLALGVLTIEWTVPRSAPPPKANPETA